MIARRTKFVEALEAEAPYEKHPIVEPERMPQTSIFIESLYQVGVRS
jgi:hypothetical protein